jgi:hypothetical protein
MAAKHYAIRIERSRRGIRCSAQGPDGYLHDNCFVSFQAPQGKIGSAGIRSDRLRQPGSPRIHHASQKSCGGHRTAATNINFSVGSGCSLAFAARNLGRVWQPRESKYCNATASENRGRTRWLYKTVTRHGRGLKRVQPVMTCAAGPVWQKPRPVRRRNGEARPQL